MEILPLCRSVSFIALLHHLEFNEAFGEKATCEPHKDVGCFFEQILEAELQNTTAV